MAQCINSAFALSNSVFALSTTIGILHAFKLTFTFFAGLLLFVATAHFEHLSLILEFIRITLCGKQVSRLFHRHVFILTEELRLFLNHLGELSRTMLL